MKGDAFMVAFPSAETATRWCLKVQKELLNVTWPKELLQHKAASIVFDPEGRMIFNGLRVRMGIHFGHPNVEQNPITARIGMLKNFVFTLNSLLVIRLHGSNW